MVGYKVGEWSVDFIDDIIAQYEKDVMRTENPNLKNPLVYGTIKLAEEAGEACGIIAKHIGQGHDLDIDDLEEELGDALYFLVYTALKAGSSLKDVIRVNMAKRWKRYPDGFESARSIDRV